MTTAQMSSPEQRYLFVRTMYAWRDLERFLIIAVATILIVRSILAAMGWPQLGGGPIHFAHLLWGGLGMVIALVLYMSMEARIWRVLAVLAAGIGFGLFIDELGKFITSDNNYFFRPAIAIVYLIFVVLVLVARFISRGVARSPQSALVNAFDLSKEAVINDMNQMQRADALRMLDRADQSDPVVQQAQGDGGGHAGPAGRRPLVAAAPAGGRGARVRPRGRQPMVQRRLHRLVRGPLTGLAGVRDPLRSRWGTRPRTSSRGPARGCS